MLKAKNNIVCKKLIAKYGCHLCFSKDDNWIEVAFNQCKITNKWECNVADCFTRLEYESQYVLEYKKDAINFRIAECSETLTYDSDGEIKSPVFSGIMIDIPTSAVIDSIVYFAMKNSVLSYRDNQANNHKCNNLFSLTFETFDLSDTCIDGVQLSSICNGCEVRTIKKQLTETVSRIPKEVFEGVSQTCINLSNVIDKTFFVCVITDNHIYLTYRYAGSKNVNNISTADWIEILDLMISEAIVISDKVVPAFHKHATPK